MHAFHIIGFRKQKYFYFFKNDHCDTLIRNTAMITQSNGDFT